MKVNIPKNKMTKSTTTPIEIYMQLEQKKENLKFHNLEIFFLTEIKAKVVAL